MNLHEKELSKPNINTHKPFGKKEYNTRSETSVLHQIITLFLNSELVHGP